MFFQRSPTIPPISQQSLSIIVMMMMVVVLSCRTSSLQGASTSIAFAWRTVPTPTRRPRGWKVPPLDYIQSHGTTTQSSIYRYQRSHQSFRLSLKSKEVDSGSSTNMGIEYQADEEKYGRGERHLSACLNEGDVVVYQGGTWLVDGVSVGDSDSNPTFHFAIVETIQLVWTHNCEHGVIRALPLKPRRTRTRLVDSTGEAPERGMTQILDIEDYELVEFGPEQLVAKLPYRLDDVESSTEIELPYRLVEEWDSWTVS